MTVERWAATAAFGFLTAGVLFRKDRRVHPWLMVTGIAIDTCLVLLLQVQRGVIQDAMRESYTLLQHGHIGSSTLAFVLYFAVVPLGARQWLRKSGQAERRWHVRVGVTAYVFRAIGFLLMFTI